MVMLAWHVWVIMIINSILVLVHTSRYATSSPQKTSRIIHSFIHSFIHAFIHSFIALLVLYVSHRLLWGVRAIAYTSN